MIPTELRGVADNVLRRAQRQGFVVPREIRGELTQAGLPDTQWKEVLSAVRESLHYRQGRYYFVQAISSRLHEQQSQQQVVFHTVRELIRRHQAVKADHDRRQHERIDFMYPAKLQTEDNREFRVLTRDLSPTGIRLIGNRSWLGQKVRIHLAPDHAGGRGCTFLVRILWACSVGDDLFENGGSFLGMVDN